MCACVPPLKSMKRPAFLHTHVPPLQKPTHPRPFPPPPNTGSIADDLFRSMNLLSLNLQQNIFTGTLPLGLPATPLSSLRFAANFLHGTIPGAHQPIVLVP